MNRGILVWLALAVVLGALSAAIVRVVVFGVARPAHVAPTTSARDAPRPARGAPPVATAAPIADAPVQPGLVALRAPEVDRRAARLARRLRRLAADGLDADVEVEATRAALVGDAGNAPVDAPPDGPTDGPADGPADGGVDAGVSDAGPLDAGVRDAGAAVVARDASAPRARVRVVVADDNDAWLKLVSVDVQIDHVRVVSRATADGITFAEGEVAYEGALFSGSHFVDATFVYRGAGGVFGYLDGYSLRVTGRQAIEVRADAITSLTVRGVDRGAIYEFEQRPQIVITTE